MKEASRLVTLCAQADERHLTIWDRHLSSLKREQGLTHVHPGASAPGDPRDDEDALIAGARLCVCLLSADLLADDKLMERAVAWRRRGVPVVGVSLRAVDLHGSSFDKTPVVPAQPVLSSPVGIDARFREAVVGVRRALAGEPPAVLGGRARALKRARRALFLILIWEKAKEILASFSSWMSGVCHVSVPAAQALVVAAAVAAPTAVVVARHIPSTAPARPNPEVRLGPKAVEPPRPRPHDAPSTRPEPGPGASPAASSPGKTPQPPGAGKGDWGPGRYMGEAVGNVLKNALAAVS